jgi:ATP-dependent protease Clp ATPase subunit
MPTNPVEPWCAFCERYQHRLVRGPSINICDECLTICNHLLRPDIPPPKSWAERVADRRRPQRLTGVGLVLLDEATVASRGLESKQVPSCSFCRKSQHEVSRLVAGEQRGAAVGRELGAEIERIRTVYICAACVELCNGIIALDGERR